MVGNVSPVVQALINNVDKVVRGKREEIRLAVCCLLTEGHLLLDDVPGTGKTTLAKAIAGSISGTWKRVQFTPDLLPTDITGVMVYDQRDMTFNFREGPVFTNVLIGDEINRGSPKTQSALLEVMEERQVTSDGITPPRAPSVLRDRHPEPTRLPGHLPAARRPARPVHDAARRSATPTRPPRSVCSASTTVTAATNRSTPSPTPNELDRLIGEVDQIEVVESINDYIVRLAGLTRVHPDLRLGVSTRGTLALLRVARAYAATEERDVRDARRRARRSSTTVFAHRMALTPEAELRGVRIDKLLADIVDEIPVPRTREQ